MIKMKQLLFLSIIFLMGFSFQRPFLAKQLTSGRRHSCAISQTGSVKCWGYNQFAQLGLGDAMNRGGNSQDMGDALPFLSLGENQTIKKIFTGSSHNCVLLEGGDIKCWGYNPSGELGLADTNNRGDQFGEMGNSLPKISVGWKVEDIILGWYHSSVLSKGQIKSWGANESGQLGIGNTQSWGGVAGQTPSVLKPIDLGKDFQVKMAASGSAHSCALSQMGEVKCWGANGSGQLGIGDTNNRGDQPDEMGDKLNKVNLGKSFTPVSIFAAGNTSCSISSQGKVKCWGGNGSGQLGYGDTFNRGDSPNEMGEGLGEVDLGEGFWATQIVGGDSYLCALSKSQRVKCWGANESGQLGLGDTNRRGDQPGEMGSELPFLVLDPVVQLSAGRFHVCGLIYNGTVKCWGLNVDGQLGVGHLNNLGDQSTEVGNELPEIFLGKNI